MRGRPAPLPPAGNPDYWQRAVKALSRKDPVLGRLIRASPNHALTHRGDPFVALARAIVGQQVSVASATSIWRRLEAALGAVTCDALAGASDATLGTCGLSRQKLAYLRDLARHFQAEGVAPGHWAAADDEAVIADLVRVKGIGRWTAEVFLIFHLQRPDVLPADDIGIRRAVQRHYFAERDAIGPKEIRALGEAWRPWRSVASWYLWRSLDVVALTY